MNTGDSNWIASFVPHSFTSRDKNQFACIIACTYGAQIVNSLQALGSLHATENGMEEFAGDKRNPITVFTALLKRYMAVDALEMEQLV